MTVWTELQNILIGIFGTAAAVAVNGESYDVVIDESEVARFDGDGTGSDTMLRFSIKPADGAALRVMSKITYNNNDYRVVSIRKDEAFLYVTALRTGMASVRDEGGIGR